MFPVSGAAQFVASASSGFRPISSQSGAYSAFVSPIPCSLSGRNMFQSPRSARVGLELLHDGRVEVRVTRVAHLLLVRRQRRIDDGVEELPQLFP